MTTECRGGVEMRVYRRRPRAPLASPDPFESPDLLESPAGPGTPGSPADRRGPHVVTYSPPRHATPGGEDGPLPGVHDSSRPLARRSARLGPRAAIRARAAPYAAEPAPETRRSSGRRGDRRPSGPAAPRDHATAALYPLCEQPSAHLQTLPLEHRPLFRLIVEAFRECSQALEKPPPRRTGTRIHRELKLAHNQWLRANRDAAIWPWRTAAVNFVAALAPRVRTHRHMHDLLMACAFWCCLAHAATCSCAGIYSTHCRHLFRAFGCGSPAPTAASA
ncbi:virion protein US10 [Cercopithecine alphaherpesvirus 2]|uniref:Tegument protein n=1 Tax=Cercopithecine alphaherpesvirus 2 TaxID=10317 RepID=Q5Y0N2_9ALPH|nr:virion protein US10 [Cercopithecine alphaherpesvirus 2]AAU88136.1 tegument protein [Cercopithecine alphaherpesvirus 2]